MLLFPLAILAHSLSFYFLFRIANPFSLHNSSIYSLRFVRVSWLHYDLTCVGRVRCDYSWHRIYLVGNGGSGFGIDFRLQKIVWLRYSQRQYRATREVRCSGHTQSRTDNERSDIGLSITHLGRIWTCYKVWAQLRFLRMFKPRLIGPKAIPRTPIMATLFS